MMSTLLKELQSYLHTELVKEVSGKIPLRSVLMLTLFEAMDQTSTAVKTEHMPCLLVCDGGEMHE